MLRLAVALAGLAGLVGLSGAATQPPNIVFVLTDDQDLVLGSMAVMNQTRALLGATGTSFRNMMAATPVCCPSRSSYITGRYIHNTGTHNNSVAGGCSGAEWRANAEQYNYGVYLQQAGYRTFYGGKYLNQYGFPAGGGISHIPPGWTDWQALRGNSIYYNYTISNNGVAEVHGNTYLEDYLPLVLHNKSLSFLSNHLKTYGPGSNDPQPFFLQVSLPTPHQPADPAPEYATALPQHTQAPRTPNYNKHLENSHWFVDVESVYGPMDANSAAWTDLLYRRRLQTLLTIDDLVSDLHSALDLGGVLDNTYFFYTSDHGYHLGQNALGLDKRQPYDTDLRVPFYVRGPGVPANSSVDDVIGNIDMAATFIDIAGVPAPSFLDGESILPKLAHATPGGQMPDTWVTDGKWDPRPHPHTHQPTDTAGVPRDSLLIEYHGEHDDAGHFTNTSACPPNDPQLNCYSQVQYDKPPFFPGHAFCSCQDTTNNTYACVRTVNETTNTIYCEFVTGHLEYYDVSTDPWQQNNLAYSLPVNQAWALQTQLAALRVCSGADCGRSTYSDELLVEEGLLPSGEGPEE